MIAAHTPVSTHPLDIPHNSIIFVTKLLFIELF